MQIACIVVNAFAEKGKSVSLDDLKLEFRRRNEAEIPRLSPEDETAIQQAFWVGLAGMQPTIIKKDKDGNVLSITHPEPRLISDPKSLRRVVDSEGRVSIQ